MGVLSAMASLFRECPCDGQFSVTLIGFRISMETHTVCECVHVCEIGFLEILNYTGHFQQNVGESLSLAGVQMT